jgi:DeoR/GlpR family transcriptional regulator of sugar metabolism
MPLRTALHASGSERRRAIRRHLEEHGELGLAEACILFGASPATLRRDFHALTRSGHGRKAWGILRAPEHADPKDRPAAESMLPFADRAGLQAEAKAAIGRAAADLVADGDSMLIDGGTTTLQMVPFLASRRVQIITNSIAIAHAIDRQRRGRLGAEVFLTGGQLLPDSFLLVGPQARATLAHYRARWAFLSAAGVDPDGVTNSNERVVEVEQAMLARAETSVLLVDSSKFHRRALTRLCDWSSLRLLLSEAPPPPGLGSRLAAAGVSVRIVPLPPRAVISQ